MSMIIILATSLAITTFLWLSGKPNLELIFRFPLLNLSQLSALLGAIIFSFNFILATRLKVLDRLSGGIDKIYRLHHKTGISAFILLIIHPLLLVLNTATRGGSVFGFLFQVSNIPQLLGSLSLYTLTIVMLVTLYARVPYDIWFKIHRIMGVPLFIAISHVFFISSDVAVNAPLRIWMLGYLSIGATSYLYKSFLYKYIGPKFEYRILDKKIKKEIIEITLVPEHKKLEFIPGQFVYFSVIDNKLISDESHPFSLASSPNDKNITLVIKMSGDYTNSLTKLAVGNKVMLRGPYGQFGDKFVREGDKEFIWIAGGIGITPFLSFLKYKKNQNTSFFYTTKTKSEAIYDKLIRKIIRNRKNIQYSYRETATDGRLTASDILPNASDLKQKLIFLCGPTSMMRDLRKQFIDHGVKSRNIILEDFSFK